MKHIFIAVGFLSFVVTGCGSSSNTGTNTQATQNCTAGYYWNASTNSCQYNGQFNQQIPNAQIPMQNFVAPVSPVIPGQPVQNYAQACPQGQYFNGSQCAVTVAQQGDCGSGQINTEGYGCVQSCEECEHSYSYLDESGRSECIPAPLTVSDCRSMKVKRNGRFVIMSNGCPNDVNGRYGIKKIKFRKDGSVRIKYRRR